jgi:aspartyl-tRNA(Asn)/glutamyl-tRNA(Gln) amidotransferase subunit A
VFGETAVDRTRQALDSAHASQSSLNVFTTIDDEGALRAAREVDAAIERGDYAGPLAGTPVALKDLIDHEGKETTCGSAFYRETATATAPVVLRLEDAGAVIIGRTGLHEWAFGFSSENPHFGPVRNPWDPSTSTGGSSGGSAAAVAAGITPIGIGTDTGGSVRVPAALCGCFGLKTTYGRIPLGGVFPLVPSIDTVGPLADSIDHLEAAYRVMADDDSDRPPVPDTLVIGVPQPWVREAPGMSDVVVEDFRSTLDSLAERGHTVTEVDAPWLVPPGLIWEAIATEVTAVHAPFRAAGMPYGDDVAARLDAAESVNVDAFEAAELWQADLRHRMARLFDTFDVLATPTVPTMKKVIGEELIDGRHYRTVLSWFSALVNHTLHPALALPVGETGAPPFSLQLIGPMDSDLLLLGIGAVLERDGLARFRRADGRFL